MRTKAVWMRVKGFDPSAMEREGMARVQVAGMPVCLVRHKGQWHAVLDRCPHQGSSFMGGWCEEGRLICPKHRMGFQLTTGEGANGMDKAQVFPVEERPDGLYIQVERRPLKVFGIRLG